MRIRKEEAYDYQKVYQLITRAFLEAEYTDHEEQNLLERLRKSKAFVPELSLVAEEEGKIVGYILFTKIKIGKDILLALAPLAVIPSMQKKGIGGKLIKDGHKIAKQMGFSGCIVMGHPTYYPKFGYQKASNFDIEAPFDIEDSYYMAIELQKDGLKDIHGKVEYPKEFLV